MAIRFRGILTDLKVLEEGQCPEQAHQLDEGSSLEEVLNQSFKKSVPIFLLMLALALVRFNKGLNWTADFRLWDIVIGGVVTVVLLSLIHI